ncbi:MAG: PEP-CTERM sorting domain-containing protein, partial [Candidatus Acidiferrales bacterium]
YDAGAKGVDFADFEIITPTNLRGQNSPQEYLYYCPPTSSPTPEPSSLFLLGTGLIGLGAFARKHLGL